MYISGLATVWDNTLSLWDIGDGLLITKVMLSLWIPKMPQGYKTRPTKARFEAEIPSIPSKNTTKVNKVNNKLTKNIIVYPRVSSVPLHYSIQFSSYFSQFSLNRVLYIFIVQGHANNSYFMVTFFFLVSFQCLAPLNGSIFPLFHCYYDSTILCELLPPPVRAQWQSRSAVE